MASRSRSFDNRIEVEGIYHLFVYGVETGTFYQTKLVGDWGTCDDVVGKRFQANPLTITKNVDLRAVLNGTQLDGLGRVSKILEHIPILGVFTESADSGWNSDNLNNLALALLARTNPSVAGTSVPTFVGELKDLPMLIKKWGTGLIRKMANANLWYRFGVRPLVSDLSSFFKFQQSVDRRLQVLKKLRSRGFVRRKVFLGSESKDTVTKRQTIHSNPVLVYADREMVARKRVWGTVNWTLPTNFVLPEYDPALRNLAVRLNYGITSWSSLETAWELLPWSWLVDWCLPVGNFISACNNTLPLTPHNVCIMRSYRKDFVWTNVSKPSWVTLDGVHRAWRIKKLRNVISGVSLPTPTLPVLSTGQWSILASLAALRAK